MQKQRVVIQQGQTPRRKSLGELLGETGSGPVAWTEDGKPETARETIIYDSAQDADEELVIGDRSLLLERLGELLADGRITPEQYQSGVEGLDRTRSFGNVQNLDPEFWGWSNPPYNRSYQWATARQPYAPWKDEWVTNYGPKPVWEYVPNATAQNLIRLGQTRGAWDGVTHPPRGIDALVFDNSYAAPVQLNNHGSWTKAVERTSRNFPDALSITEYPGDGAFVIRNLR